MPWSIDVELYSKAGQDRLLTRTISDRMDDVHHANCFFCLYPDTLFTGFQVVHFSIRFLYP